MENKIFPDKLMKQINEGISKYLKLNAKDSLISPKFPEYIKVLSHRSPKGVEVMKLEWAGLGGECFTCDKPRKRTGIYFSTITRIGTRKYCYKCSIDFAMNLKKRRSYEYRNITQY